MNVRPDSFTRSPLICRPPCVAWGAIRGVAEWHGLTSHSTLQSFSHLTCSDWGGGGLGGITIHRTKLFHSSILTLDQRVAMFHNRRNFSNISAIRWQHTTWSLFQSMGEIMQPLVLVESPQTMWLWRCEGSIELTVGSVCKDVLEPCVLYIRLFSGQKSSRSDVYRRVQSCNWACVPRLQMLAWTANQQFWVICEVYLQVGQGLYFLYSFTPDKFTTRDIYSLISLQSGWIFTVDSFDSRSTIWCFQYGFGWTFKLKKKRKLCKCLFCYLKLLEINRITEPSQWTPESCSFSHWGNTNTTNVESYTRLQGVCS